MPVLLTGIGAILAGRENGRAQVVPEGEEDGEAKRGTRKDRERADDREGLRCAVVRLSKCHRTGGRYNQSG